MKYSSVELVAPNGKVDLVPKVIYHGTNQKFLDERLAKNPVMYTPDMSIQRIWCARDPKRAYDFALERAKSYGADPRLLVVLPELAIEEYDFTGNEEGDVIFRQLPVFSYRIFDCSRKGCLEDGSLDVFIQEYLGSNDVDWKKIMNSVIPKAKEGDESPDIDDEFENFYNSLSF